MATSSSIATCQDPEQDFQMLEQIGRGAYGSVHKALHKPTGEIVAIKIVPNNQQISVLQREIKILEECDSDYIVKFYGSYLMTDTLWIVMEYCAAGSISDLIRICQRVNVLREDEIASIMQAILRGLDYLHRNKKIHRDVKAGNILLDQKGNVKLADFGVSAQIATNAQRDTVIGSPYWMSPQMLSESRYDQKTDIWSLGITAIEIAEGAAPYSNMHPFRAMFVIKKNPTKGLAQKHLWSEQFHDLVSCCLRLKASERLTAAELLNHPFIAKVTRGRAILSQLFCGSIDAIQKERFKENKKKLNHDNQNSLQLKFVDEYKDTIKQQENSIKSFSRVDTEEEEEVYDSGTLVVRGTLKEPASETEFVKFAKKMNEAQVVFSNKQDVHQMIDQLRRKDQKQEVAIPRPQSENQIRESIRQLDQQCEQQLNSVLESYRRKITSRIQDLKQIHNKSLDRGEIKSLNLTVPHLVEVKKFLASRKEVKNINNINSINISINQAKRTEHRTTRNNCTNCQKEASEPQDAFKKVKKYQQFVDDTEVFEYIKKTYLNKK